jgi:hypothetical protein
MIAFLIGVFLLCLIWRRLLRPSHVEIVPPAPRTITS